MPATTHDETPVFFPAGSEELFGILTRPVGTPNGLTAVILTGAGWLPATNRNRLSVRMARQLADAGFHTLRMEYHGTGESTGVVRAYRLDRPFVSDLEGAITWMRRNGHEEFVVVGSCFGARTLLATADRITNLRGVIMVAPSVRDLEQGTRGVDRTSSTTYARRAFSRRFVGGLFDGSRRRIYGRILRRKTHTVRTSIAARLRREGREEALADVSRSFLDALSKLTRRGVPTLFLYGERDEFYTTFRAGCAGRLGSIIADAGPLVEVRVIPEAIVHGFATLTSQDAVAGAVGQWLSELAERIEPAGVSAR